MVNPSHVKTARGQRGRRSQCLKQQTWGEGSSDGIEIAIKGKGDRYPGKLRVDVVVTVWQKKNMASCNDMGQILWLQLIRISVKHHTDTRGKR